MCCVRVMVLASNDTRNMFYFRQFYGTYCNEKATEKHILNWEKIDESSSAKGHLQTDATEYNV